MDFTLLKGQHGHYIFFPDNPATALRASGKFGSVYLGARHDNQEKVTVKILHPSLSVNAAAVERFKKEVTAVPSIHGLIKADDYCFQSGMHFLIRPYIEGSTLAEYLRNSKLKASSRIRFVLVAASKVLTILAALHRTGIIHRDVRPQNILAGCNKEGVTTEDDPAIYLLDLGLARFPSEETESGNVPFSLLHASPEQVLNRNDAVDVRSDLYSLGITLYELLAGLPPFHHRNPELLMNLQIGHPLPQHEKIPAAVFNILEKATAKHRFPLPPIRYSREETRSMLEEGKQRRYQSAEEMKKSIEKLILNLKEPKGFFQRLFF